MPSVHLADRGVVRVSGEDAKSFLDGLVTCDLDRISPASARFGGLLAPQGKILFDFIMFQAPPEIGGGYYLDALKVHAPDLAKRLGFYRLRAKVAIEDLSETLAVVAGWDAPRPGDDAGLVAEDPRLPDLGWRAVVAAEDAAEFAAEPAERYHARRIALGVPEGGRDFLFGDAFPTRPSWTSCAGSISTRAAMWARRWSRACSTGARRGPGSCQPSTRAALRRRRASR